MLRRPISHMHEPVICTASGRCFDLLNPDPAAVDRGDIAHALGMTPRFGGHTRTFFSVAQHSLLVADLVAKEHDDRSLELVALLHDAAEAYLVDMPAPIKQHLPDFRAIEDRVQAAVFEAFGLAELAAKHKAVIKAADRLALQWEQRDLGPHGDWLEVAPLEELPTILPLGPEAARDAMLERFIALDPPARESIDRS